METYVKLGALGQAALEALVAGVGIAFFFALGLRGLASWNGEQADDVVIDLDSGQAAPTAALARGRRHVAGLALAVVCFAGVATIVITGLYVMLASK
jgi:hypothetical protein